MPKKLPQLFVWAGDKIFVEKNAKFFKGVFLRVLAPFNLKNNQAGLYLYSRRYRFLVRGEDVVDTIGTGS
ncbi:MAG: hypothetical protein AB1599_00120 [Planctomycetota bacterium]